MTAVPRVEEAQQDLARVLTPKSISTAPLAGAARPHLAIKRPLPVMFSCFLNDVFGRGSGSQKV